MNKVISTIVLAAAAGVAGALLYNRFLKKPCKCKDNTEPPIVGKGTVITGDNLQSNEATLNYIGKLNKKRNVTGGGLENIASGAASIFWKRECYQTGPTGLEQYCRYHNNITGENTPWRRIYPDVY